MNKNIDIELAMKLRDDSGYAIAVTRKHNTIYKSKSRGIYPLYAAYKEQIDFTDANAADRVVGKGAALFFVKLNVARIDTLIISKPALRYLQKNNVVVSYAKLVDYIQNRDRDGKCPVETIAEKTSQFDAFLNEVEKFLKRLELI